MEFVGWDKTPRYFRDVVITEKIDGTNAAVVIVEHDFGTHQNLTPDPNLVSFEFGPLNPLTGMPDKEYTVFAQSRKRLITPWSDNAGFARWVGQNAPTLIDDLGPGRHFGEWWGQGIQRRYGLDYKVFSLFNTAKWSRNEFVTPYLDVVPVLYSGPHTPTAVIESLDMLRETGSLASVERGVWFQAPKTKGPEGVCIFHTASNSIFKATIEDDQSPKSEVIRNAA